MEYNIKTMENSSISKLSQPNIALQTFNYPIPGITTILSPNQLSPFNNFHDLSYDTILFPQSQPSNLESKVRFDEVKTGTFIYIDKKMYP